jgi:anti-sigma regulatory factor (Ser/Thr protein kinase)
MEMTSAEACSIAWTLDDPSGVGEVRRAAAALADRMGFSREDAGRLALIATEAGNNLVQHGGGGEIIVRAMSDRTRQGIELLMIDRGAGIADVGRALQDGYSTAGTPGTGLGAVTRLADLFDIHSVPQQGTVLLAQVWRRDATAGAQLPDGDLEVGAVCLPRRGEHVCGDAWAVAPAPDGGTLLLVVDGLGHGPGAAGAAEEALRIFRQGVEGGPGRLLGDMHAALRSTRGAAVAAALLDSRRREIRYAGVGNIAGTVLAGTESRSMVSHNGTVGHEVRKIQEFVYPWTEGALVIMHSDGLQTHWRLDRYQGIRVRHPGVIAGLLYRDFNRGRDDVTVLGVREAVARASNGGPGRHA